MKMPNYHCLVTGDINLDLLRHATHADTGKYVDMLITNNFTPLTFAPTRITDSSATAIDHFYLSMKSSNLLSMNISTGNISFPIADHLVNYLILTFDKRQKETKNRPMIRLFSEKAKNNFCNKILNYDWSTILNTFNCPSVLFNTFYEKISDVYNEVFPLVKCSRKRWKDKMWLTKGVLKSSATKQKLYQCWLLSQNPNDREKYLRYNRIFSNITKKLEKDYYEKLFNTKINNIKSIWNNINKIISFSKKSNPKTRSISNLLVNNINLADPIQIANEFNDYFCSIGSNLMNKIPSCNTSYNQYLNNPVSNSFFCEPFEVTEVANCLTQLLNKKSSNSDAFNSQILNLIAPVLAQPISHIFNLSINAGIFPESLKLAKVIPIFKKGDPKLPANYRPISLLSNFGKLFEKLIVKRLLNFLNKYNILSQHQFGFRKNHSTTLALINIIDNIYQNLNDNHFVIGIFLDLSKAFDAIDISLLSKKLYYYGVRGKIHDWFVSYLTNRKQYVYVNNVSSDIKCINCGVPQGSVLGPILFLLFINDLTSIPALADMLKLFADDTNLFISDSNITHLETKCNIALTVLAEWMSANKLTINYEKTCYMLFRPHLSKKLNYSLNVTINNTIINCVESIKFLGIILDNKLTWKLHIDDIYNSLMKYVGIFYKLRPILSLSVMKSIYFATVHSKLLYGLELYGNTFPSYLDNLIILNNKILRITQNKKFHTHRYILYQKFSTFPIDLLFKYNLLLFVHKLIYKNMPMPSCFSNYFPTNDNVHSHQTRSNKQIHLLQINNNFGSKNIKHLGAQLWNSLPTSLTKINNLHHFKKMLKPHFYSL